jgi:XTP/dITP diphosphohydrolase
MEIVCASANPDKVKEIEALLCVGEEITLLPRPSDIGDVIEDADSLVGNARLKAFAIARATGKAAVADDTGFFVDALGGAPGVMAARFAGEGCSYADNVRKVLVELDKLEDKGGERRAQFRTIALLGFPDGTEIFCEGVVDGAIPLAPLGEGGFGYDPIFVPDGGDGRSFAQMSAQEKEAISHRGRAFRSLREEILRNLRS